MKKRYENWKRIFDQDFPQPELGGYHSIQCGQIYFILLDNYNGSHQYTYLSKEQTVWLDEELKKASDRTEIRYIILGMHHPPFSTGEAGCDPILGQLFESRVTQFPKISLILAGHCHFYQRFEVKNKHSTVNYIVTGGGGGLLDQWITKKWTKRPYFWNSNGHLQNVQFDLDISKKHKLRNDQFVKRYHKKSIIQNHFLFITVDKNQIYISVRTWQNDEIESFSIPTIPL